MDVSSTSSAQGMLTSTNSFYRMIRDFKKVLGERKTPRNLILLNWVLVITFSLSIVLSSVEYSQKLGLFTDITTEYKHSFFAHIRSAKLVLIASNLRSLVNVANNYEPNSYEGEGLIKVNRFAYLNRLIQTQADSLQGYQDFLAKQRNNNGEADSQSQFEYNTIPLYRLDQNAKIYRYSLPYRLAVTNYLNSILTLNQSAVADL